MGQKQVRGIGGVLGHIISRNEAATNAPEEQEIEAVNRVETTRPSEVLQAEHASSDATGSERPPASPPKSVAPSKKQEARRGRPPGNKTPTAPVEREKVSLRLRSDLAATYRDWSWKEQCQFSELVDRALEFYWMSRVNARKPEKK